MKLLYKHRQILDSINVKQNSLPGFLLSGRVQCYTEGDPVISRLYPCELNLLEWLKQEKPPETWSYRVFTHARAKAAQSAALAASARPKVPPPAQS
jgi:hypothetical protein